VLTRVISQTQCPGSAFKSKTVKSKGVPHLEAWDTAFKGQLKLVNGFER
jgi:hypothetical protein